MLCDIRNHPVAEDPATLFNERVWGSTQMRLAINYTRDGLAELETGEGWGLLALDNAESALRNALELVRAMQMWGRN